MLAEDALSGSRCDDDECRQDDRHANSLIKHLSLQVCCYSAQHLTCGDSWRCDEAFRLAFGFVDSVNTTAIVLAVEPVFTTLPVGC